LGAEKDGIPVTLLQELDIVVEIPQLGLTRSMNVHVSASLLLWEYTRQRMERAGFE
jgi:tRNA G18 (ribose-2'-O)-methylase SpoU